ncbi:hypothetical protein V6R85_24215 [Agrobacterium sp. CCNWLW32]|uniref:hypothetical protein n=1 Tax=Agrobacterium sp. CCNWLW32 TaxID=3122072 RepID=UPI0030102D2E
MNTAIAVEDFPQEPWERVFPDPNGVYTFDNVHSAEVPHWTMHSPSELPIVDPDGNYHLDVGPGNPHMHQALFDLALEVRRILPTARIKVAPRLYLPDSNGEMILQKSFAVTEFDARLGKHGWFAVPTLLLSTNQGVEEAFREAYRFLWLLIETEIPFLESVPRGTMKDIEKMSFVETNAIFYDWLLKFPKLPGEARSDFLLRIAQERRALTFSNMAMDRLGGCWDDDASTEADLRRKTHDMMFRWALRGTLGKVIKDEYGPVPESGPAQPISEIGREEVERMESVPSLSEASRQTLAKLLETEDWG